jgi:hypothetical protein
MSSNIVIKVNIRSQLKPLLDILRADPNNARIISDIWLTLMNNIDFLQYRLMRYIDIIHRFFTQREWRQEALEDIGERILELAEENARRGYQGTESLSSAGISWEERNEIVQQLYQAAGYGNPEGLTTGRDHLINSLRIGDTNNIFTVNPDLGHVILGTNWKFAKLLEEGGFRDPNEPHLGVVVDVDGSMRPAEWLMAAIGADNAWELVNELADQDPYIPPRPFLKPALWYSIHDDFIGKTLVEIIIYYLSRLLKELPLWSHQDQVDVESETTELN